MHGKQLTALQLAEQRESIEISRVAPDLVWLVDWRALKLPHCSIYVIAPIDGWPCKIGVSTNPQKRVAALQTSVWKQLEVVWCGAAPTVDSAVKIERKAHSSLSDRSLWLHGEWFDLRPDKAIELVRFEAEMMGIELAERLPEGPALDFVNAVIDRKYRTPSGMIGKIQRRYEFLGLDR